jgi:NADH-quinone oxidoreductase subunit N
MFLFVNIEFIDLVYFLFQATILLCALFALLKLSSFTIDNPNGAIEQKIIDKHRKTISFVITNTIFTFLSCVLSLMFGSYIVFNHIAEVTIGFMHLNEAQNINNLSVLSMYDNSFANFNFHNEINFFVLFWQFLVSLSMLIILASVYGFLQNNKRSLMEFPIIMTLATFFLCVLVSATDFFVAFIATIGFSINTYVLILSNPDDKNCCEAGIKYFYLSAFSSGLIAFSLLILFIIFSTFNFISIEDTLKEWHLAADGAIGLITCFICFFFLGFFFKLSAWPCHIWAPAVYEGSPQPIMAFFILPIKISVLVFIFKITATVLKDLYMLYSFLFWFSSIFSMLTGGFAALLEKHVKKFLAYSSINQMGFLLIGIVGGTANSLESSAYYLFIYMLMNTGLFIILLNTWDVVSKRQIIYLTDLAHFAKNNWKTTIMLTIILFSMAGIPPLAGFFGKFYLFLEAATQSYYSLILIGLFTTMLSTYYYLRLIKHLLFDKLDIVFVKFTTNLSPILQFFLQTVCLFLIINLFLTDIFYNEICCF